MDSTPVTPDTPPVDLAAATAALQQSRAHLRDVIDILLEGRSPGNLLRAGRVAAQALAVQRQALEAGGVNTSGPIVLVVALSPAPDAPAGETFVFPVRAATLGVEFLEALEVGSRNMLMLGATVDHLMGHLHTIQSRAERFIAGRARDVATTVPRSDRPRGVGAR